MTSISNVQVSRQTAEQYVELFVNRLAHTIQSHKPHRITGRFYYYRSRSNSQLTLETVAAHLEGQMTVGLYAINPTTQRCKWVAIDADYANAVEDLLKLQWELRQDGVEAALEKSRRGGHLWIFADRPLLARDCRLYIHHLAQRLNVPVKGSCALACTEQPTLAEGIEVFPKQDRVANGEFGNAIRGPLGIHRATGKRYWFYGADYSINAQVAYLLRLKRLTPYEISEFVAGLSPAEKIADNPKNYRRFSYNGNRDHAHKEFLILEHLNGKKRRSGRNYFTACPSCERHGRDRSGDNLAISISDPRKYKCRAGCSKEEIRAALGCPARLRD